MLNYNKIRQYNQIAHSIRFPIEDKPFAIIYFPENEIPLVSNYQRLNIRKMDARIVIIPYSKFPIFRMTSNIRQDFKKLGLYAFKDFNSSLITRNLFIDLSYFFYLVDSKFSPGNYRARYGSIIQNYMLEQITKLSDTHKIVILYCADLTKPISPYISRKSYILLNILGNSNEVPLMFDDILFCSLTQSDSIYRVLCRDKQFNLARIVPFLRNIKVKVEREDDEIDEIANKATDNVVDSLKDDKNISHITNKKQVKTAIKTLMKKDNELADDVSEKKLSPNEAKDIVIQSTLYSSSGDFRKSHRISKSIPPMKQDVAIKQLNSNVIDEILHAEKVKSTSDIIAIKSSNPDKLVDDKVPTHIFQKRQIDFEQNLGKDMGKSFKVLEDKDIPIKLQSIEIKGVVSNPREINQSDISIVNVVLKDEFGNKHLVKIQIPLIDPKTGTFRVNGRRKCLINQLVLCPISFPKKYDSRFESSYSHFHIYSKKGKKSVLTIYLGSYRLPLFVLICYYLGLDKVESMYKFSHTISSKDSKEKPSTKLSSGEYVIFDNIDTDLKEELVNSFSLAKPDSYKNELIEEFGSKKYFEKLIILLTGTRNSVWVIQQILNNVVDPVSKQVLINKQLPSDLSDIMKYMASRTVIGFEENRNDLANQRIRNSEILVHLIQKQILAAYTDYRKQVLSGNKQAQFIINPTKTLRDFINSEIVVDMEYANPAEEMATISRISPVGSQVGGIPSKISVNTQSRNIHPSYFGNIDPIDTPEGANIGVVQQLAVDVSLTTARGIISVKPMDDKEASGMLSTGSCMIPFIENNEGARIMMACNQQRQVSPIENSEIPLVQSGYESLLTNMLSDNFIKRSPCNGLVKNISTDYIEISCEKEDTKVDITPRNLRSGSGKNSLSIFKPVVKKSQKVKKDQIIAEGACINKGMICNGMNLLVAVMPYEGYNFEDGVVMSSSIYENNKFVSIHLITEEFNISEKDKITYICDIGEYIKKGEPLVKKIAGEISELLGFEEDEESSKEIISGEIVLKSPGGRIADIQIFSNVKKGTFPKLQKYIDRTNHRKGISKGYSLSGRHIEGAIIFIRIEQTMQVMIGDKFCNRYGNKGVVAILKDKDLMPRTPWGEHIEMVMNPLGIINRMNPGQLYEMYCGLIARNLGERIFSYGNNGKDKTITLLNKTIPLLDNTKNKMYSNGLISQIKSLSNRTYPELLEQIKRIKGFPLIIPPFKSPNSSKIKECMKTLGLKGGYKLFLPDYGVYTHSEVPVGYMLIQKLEHMSEAKLHARSVGGYTGKTLQPPAGKARDGGQRMGEGETYALLSANAPTVLSEFFGPMSDDIKTKQEIISDIIEDGNAPFRQPKTSPSKDLLKAYFSALAITEE